MLELALPFAASLVVTLLLRRLDKSNLNLKKLKTVVERSQKELLELALRKKEELKDATTNFDVLLINSEKYLQNLQQKLEEARTSLSSVEETRSNIKQMDGELQSLETTTRSVTDQLKFINESLDKIDLHQKKLKKLQDHIRQVDDEGARMIGQFQEAIKFKYDEITGVMEKKFSEIHGETINAHKGMRDDFMSRHAELKEQVMTSYNELESGLKKSAREVTATIEERLENQLSIIDEVQSRISAAEKNLEITVPGIIKEIKADVVKDLSEQASKLEALKAQMTGAEENFRKRIGTFREELENHKTLMFEDIGQESDRIRQQIQGLDLDALTKRDEILKAARSEVTKIQRNIDDFNDFYTRARETLFQEAARRENELVSRIQDLENSSRTVHTQMTEAKQTTLAELQTHLQNALENVRDESRRVFADSLREFDREHDSVNRRLDEIREKAGNIRELAEEKFELLEGRYVEISARAEKNISESQNRILRVIKEKEDEFEKTAETWQARLESLLAESREEMHRNQVEFERGRSDLVISLQQELDERVTRMEQLSKDFKDDNYRTMSELLHELKTRILEKEADFSSRIDSHVARFSDMKKNLEGQYGQAISVISDEKLRLEEDVKRITDNQLELFDDGMQEKVKRHATIIHGAAQEALDDIRKRTQMALEDFTAVKEDADETLRVFQDNQREVFSAIIDETRKAGQDIRELQGALKELKNETPALEKTRALAETVKTLIRELSEKIELAEGRNQHLTEIYKKVEELKDMRVKLESELMLTAQKREKIDKIEETLHLLITLKDQIENKAGDLQKVRDMVLEITNGYAGLDEQRKRVDNSLDDLFNEQKLIEKTVQNIERQEKSVEALRENTEKITHLFQKMEARTISLKEEIDKLSNELLSLKKHEGEIQEIRGRFLEIEDLMEDIDKKKNQIDIMRKRYEELRQSMTTEVMQIERIEQNAESKVRQLSEFMQVLEGDMPNANLTKSLNPAGVADKKHIILQLANEFKWKPDEIASAVKLDVSTVKTILKLQKSGQVDLA